MELDLDCQNCTTQMKKERGCNADGIVPFYLDEKRYMRCPIKLVSNKSWQYIYAYSFFKKGILPNGKGWNFETEKYLSAMITLDTEISKVQQEKIDKANRKAGRNRIKGRNHARTKT